MPDDAQTLPTLSEADQAALQHWVQQQGLGSTVTDVEPRADLVRVHAGDLSADVTVQAAADLGLAAGSRVTFTVKATEVSVYGL